MRFVVVGGGVAGILAAAQARRAGATVTLIESGPRLGGLLTSERIADHDVDCGTHIPQETGDPDVDGLLFARMGDAPWLELPHQRAGNLFGGEVNAHSPFPDVRSLGPELRANVLRDLIDASFSDEGPPVRDAAAALREIYGSSATEHVFRPPLEGHFGVALEQLEPGAERFFFQRLIVADEHASDRLKSLPELDDRIAFTTFEAGVSPRRAWYPAHGGAGRWISDIEERCLDGVDTKTNARVAAIDGDGQVSRLVLDDGEEIQPDVVVWTAPVVHLLSAANLPIPDDVQRPRFLPTTLHHLVLDRPSTQGLQYLTNYDPGVGFFRVTFYDQLTGSHGPTSALTVEIFSDDPPQTSVLDAERVRERLADAGLIDQRASVVAYRRQEIPVGFPIPFVGSSRSTQRLAEAAGELKNVQIAGRASGKAFFMADALKHTWDCVDAALA